MIDPFVKYKVEKSVVYSLEYLKLKITQQQLTKIKDISRDCIANNFQGLKPFGHQLAGHLKHEYICPKNLSIELHGILNDLQPILSQENLGIIINDEGNPELWINFQEKGETNPLHTHKGLLSFVLWVEIPYERHKTKRNQSVVDGGFTFAIPCPSYIEQSGIFLDFIDVDKTMEGTLIIFPSSWHHYVVAFNNSDDFRISISGNLGPVDGK